LSREEGTKGQAPERRNRMDQGTVVDLAQQALKIVIYVSAPMLLISMIVGLAISIFQATTQIQEQTLTFVPKILAVIAAIAMFGAWMLRVLIEYTENLYINMNQYIR
jgi:flagellar biosynthesis protein FliQ